MPTTICTFNVNNLFARYKFESTYAGDMGKKSLVGADWGYLPIYKKGLFELFSPEQRALAAQVIRRGTQTKLPDVLCLVEVESLLALREFNEKHLGGYYDHALLIDSRDFRLIDVAVLSRRSITAVRTHVDDPDPSGGYLFSRDCLEVEVATNKSGSKSVRLYLNHLKSKLAKSPAEEKKGDAKRLRQSGGVVRILKERHKGSAFEKDRFVVLGDLNDTPGSAPLAPLFSAGLEDMLARHPDLDGRWTHWWRKKNTVAQLDHVLLSPALQKETKGQLPELERRGIGFNGQDVKKAKAKHEDKTAARFDFARFAGVGKDAASDHAAIFFEIG